MLFDDEDDYEMYHEFDMDNCILDDEHDMNGDDEIWIIDKNY